MLMIVSFHLCVGNRYDWFLAQPPTPTKVAYQFLRGGGWVGNFIFFTISIWFLLDRQNTLKSSLKRIWILERELLFWSLALFAATLFLRKAGLYSGSVLKLAAHSVLPLTTSLWWYPTSYAMFLLLLPFLVTGMKALDERAHRSLALIALLMWGIAGLLPFTRNDLHGGSVLVFVYWFVLLSYYRWYMERISAATCWKLILAGLGIEVVYCLAFSLVFAMTGKGAGFQFFLFDNWKIPSMFIGFGLFELFARREFHSRCVKLPGRVRFRCLPGSLSSGGQDSLDELASARQTVPVGASARGHDGMRIGHFRLLSGVGPCTPGPVRHDRRPQPRPLVRTGLEQSHGTNQTHASTHRASTYGKMNTAGRVKMFPYGSF